MPYSRREALLLLKLLLLLHLIENNHQRSLSIRDNPTKSHGIEMMRSVVRVFRNFGEHKEQLCLENTVKDFVLGTGASSA